MTNLKVLDKQVDSGSFVTLEIEGQVHCFVGYSVFYEVSFIVHTLDKSSIKLCQKTFLQSTQTAYYLMPFHFTLSLSFLITFFFPLTLFFVVPFLFSSVVSSLHLFMCREVALNLNGHLSARLTFQQWRTLSICDTVDLKLHLIVSNYPKYLDCR